MAHWVLRLVLLLPWGWEGRGERAGSPPPALGSLLALLTNFSPGTSKRYWTCHRIKGTATTSSFTGHRKILQHAAEASNQDYRTREGEENYVCDLPVDWAQWYTTLSKSKLDRHPDTTHTAGPVITWEVATGPQPKRSRSRVSNIQHYIQHTQLKGPKSLQDHTDKQQDCCRPWYHSISSSPPKKVDCSCVIQMSTFTVHSSHSQREVWDRNPFFPLKHPATQFLHLQQPLSFGALPKGSPPLCLASLLHHPSRTWAAGPITPVFSARATPQGLAGNALPAARHLMWFSVPHTADEVRVPSLVKRSSQMLARNPSVKPSAGEAGEGEAEGWVMPLLSPRDTCMLQHPGNRKESVPGLNKSETLTSGNLCEHFCLVLLQYTNLALNAAGFHPKLRAKLLKTWAFTESPPKITILVQVCLKFKSLLQAGHSVSGW